MGTDLVKSVRSGDTYTQFKKVVETVKNRADVEGGTKEALSLHATRLSRGIRGKDRYSPMLIVDACLQDLSIRARLVEIRVKNDLQFATLKEAIDSMRRHITTEYNDELKEEFSTAEQRRAFVDRVVKNAKAYLAEGEAFVSMVDAIIKDIDQAGYQIKAIVECLKLLDGSKSGKVV